MANINNVKVQIKKSFMDHQIVLEFCLQIHQIHIYIDLWLLKLLDLPFWAIDHLYLL